MGEWLCIGQDVAVDAYAVVAGGYLPVCCRNQFAFGIAWHNLAIFQKADTIPLFSKSMAMLNPQQQAAVRHRHGPLLILAGAGTGKTSVITQRIAGLLRENAPAANILGVTFTNKAAAEMRQRVNKLVGAGKTRDLILSTFHSLAVRIIRRDAERLGYSPSFAICDQGEQLALMRKAASTVTCADMPGNDDLLVKISSLKNKAVMPDEFRRQAVDDWENALAAVYRRYQEALKRQNSLDFDDLLVKALELIRNHPDVASYWRTRFAYIMVDEFQDTNKVQFELVQLLAEPRNNVAVVGDDDQSIYSWRGALAGNILKFHDVYPNAKLIALEQNYRSTQTILSAANAVIKTNSGRREKNLWSEIGVGKPVALHVHNEPADEAAAIASAIRGRKQEAGGKYADFAVIVRANAQAKLFEDEFMASRIPYEVIGGQSLYDRKEARDVLAFLAVIANPEADNQLLRIINVPPRGIGEKTIDLLSEKARQARCSIFSLLADPEENLGLQKNQSASCRKFAAQIDAWRQRLCEAGYAGLVKAVLEETGYQEELAALYANPLEAASRWNEALEVETSLAAFAAKNKEEYPDDQPSAIITKFLQEAMLAGKADGAKRDSAYDSVKIITAHSAKGLEYPYVFIPGLEEGIFPHKNSIADDNVEEERRLFYVAMTRARLELTLSYSRARTSRGKTTEMQPSRFLEEIPAELLQVDSAPTRVEETADWLAGLREQLGM